VECEAFLDMSTVHKPKCKRVIPELEDNLGIDTFGKLEREKRYILKYCLTNHLPLSKESLIHIEYAFNFR